MVRRMTRTLRLPIFIHASPKRVFKWISDDRRLTRWLSDAAALSARKGGRYRLGWDGGPTHTGRVLAFARGKQLTLSWQWPGKEHLGPTKLKLAVEPADGGTVLRFLHSGFGTTGEWVELYEGAIRGWTYFMMNLKSVLESDRDLRSPLDW
ncbi:MAG TPA: SRPBCC domain-containing protein [Thermoplasmata archaeon]|nr:SRPBCC domain-containing protein [Thermoplasmata archaeon]